MVYIITGATSMLGLATCQFLSECGHTVYAVCRPASDKVAKLQQIDGVNIIYLDLAHISEAAGYIVHADVFINYAWASTSHSGRENEAIQQQNVDDTLMCMRTAAKMGCRLFVEAGSQAEYGYVPTLITEDTPCNPETPYGRAKLQVFESGARLCAELGMGYIHLRIFSVFGENDRPWTLIMTAIEKLSHGETLELSDCTQYWNYLYAPDAAKQISLLCEYYIQHQKMSPEIYHIASKDTRVLKDFIEELRDVLSSRSELKYGAFSPSSKVSLQPSVDKTLSAINFNADYTFSNAIRQIINKVQSL